MVEHECFAVGYSNMLEARSYYRLATNIEAWRVLLFSLSANAAEKPRNSLSCVSTQQSRV